MDSIDFALELFDALARRRLMTLDTIDGDQLREFWEQISAQSFDSRLQTFFDMLRLLIFIHFELLYAFILFSATFGDKM